MRRSEIRALGVSEELASLFDSYTDALQDDDIQTGQLGLLAKFMVAAYRDGVVFDGSQVDIIMPREIWGHDIPLQQTDLVDAMAALLIELED